jgi:uncharacterized membrane protein
MFLALFGLLWHVFAIASYFILVPYGRRWEGFYIGLLLGPLGLTIVLFMRERLRAEAQAEALRKEVEALREQIVERLPNGKPMGSQGF